MWVVQPAAAHCIDALMRKAARVLWSQLAWMSQILTTIVGCPSRTLGPAGARQGSVADEQEGISKLVSSALRWLVAKEQCAINSGN